MIVGVVLGLWVDYGYCGYCGYSLGIVGISFCCGGILGILVGLVRFGSVWGCGKLYSILYTNAYIAKDWITFCPVGLHRL